MRDATDWPLPDATPSEFFLGGEKSEAVTSLNDGSLTATPPPADGGETRGSYPDLR